MPPMMLLPLVDHATAHGQATASIRIDAAIAGGKLQLVVSDSGNSFAPGYEAEGIAGIRERLAALYGDTASVELRRAGEQRTEAVVAIPVEAPAAQMTAATGVDAALTAPQGIATGS